ncbi:MAG: SH3 domain-containing protein [Synergistaceae bacterium]|nr:SH3 domain-containing protein [Synergistaceae bacterium]
MAYALLVGNKPPEPIPDPGRIIRPTPPIDLVASEEDEFDFGDVSADAPVIGPIASTSDVPADTGSSAGDQFSDPAQRAAAYKVSNAALKRTVDQYAKTRANHCAGEITVQTDDTPLNVRSGPSTGNPVLTKATKGSKQSVLLWAPDSRNQSARWFLLVDDSTKAVKGWVSAEYCDSSSVVFAN